MNNLNYRKIISDLKTELFSNYGYTGWQRAVQAKGLSLDEVDETNVRILWYGRLYEDIQERTYLTQVESYYPKTRAQYELAIGEIILLTDALKYEFMNIKMKGGNEQ